MNIWYTAVVLVSALVSLSLVQASHDDEAMRRWQEASAAQAFDAIMHIKESDITDISCAMIQGNEVYRGYLSRGLVISAVLYRDTSTKCHIDDGGRLTPVDTKYFAVVKAAYAKQQESKKK